LLGRLTLPSESFQAQEGHATSQHPGTWKRLEPSQTTPAFSSLTDIRGLALTHFPIRSLKTPPLRVPPLPPNRRLNEEFKLSLSGIDGNVSLDLDASRPFAHSTPHESPKPVSHSPVPPVPKSKSTGARAPHISNPTRPSFLPPTSLTRIRPQVSFEPIRRHDLLPVRV